MSAFYRGFIAELEKKAMPPLIPIATALAPTVMGALTKPKATKNPALDRGVA
jgi:hypothetical protein